MRRRICVFFLCWAVFVSSMNATACYFVTGMEHENAEIARGLRRRDADLLDRLIEQYQHRLLRYLVYLAGNRELAEDLFQETWMRVLERGHQYDGRHEFSTWLSVLVRNLGPQGAIPHENRLILTRKGIGADNVGRFWVKKDFRVICSRSNLDAGAASRALPLVSKH